MVQANPVEANSEIKSLSHNEEVSSISNPPADVCLGGGFEIDVSAAAIMKRFEQISDEDLNIK